MKNQGTKASKLLLLLAVGLLTSPFSIAQAADDDMPRSPPPHEVGPEGGHGPRGRGGPGGGLFRVVRELDLSKEQKTKLKDIAKKNGEKMKALMEEMHTIFPKIHAAMEEESFDLAAAKKMHERQKEINSSLSDLRFQQMVDLRDILSPEQRKKLGEKMKEHGPPRGSSKGGKRFRGKSLNRASGNQ